MFIQLCEYVFLHLVHLHFLLRDAGPALNAAEVNKSWMFMGNTSAAN